MTLPEWTNHVSTQTLLTTPFAPQYQYIDMNIPVRLWPMERLADMLHALGWEGDIPHVNESKKIWSAEEFRALPNIDKLMERYAPDWDLYNKAI